MYKHCTLAYSGSEEKKFVAMHLNPITSVSVKALGVGNR